MKLKARVETGCLGKLLQVKSTARDHPLPPLDYLKVSSLTSTFPKSVYVYRYSWCQDLSFRWILSRLCCSWPWSYLLDFGRIPAECVHSCTCAHTGIHWHERLGQCCHLLEVCEWSDCVDRYQSACVLRLRSEMWGERLWPWSSYQKKLSPIEFITSAFTLSKTCSVIKFVLQYSHLMDTDIQHIMRNCLFLVFLGKRAFFSGFRNERNAYLRKPTPNWVTSLDSRWRHLWSTQTFLPTTLPRQLRQCTKFFRRHPPRLTLIA